MRRERRVVDERRVGVAHEVVDEDVLEAVRDLLQRLHPEERLGVAGVAAGLGLGGAFEDGDARALLGRRDRGRKPRDAAADHDDVIAVGLLGHGTDPLQKWSSAELVTEPNSGSMFATENAWKSARKEAHMSSTTVT